MKAAQTYSRLDEFTYRYASGTFGAELSVDDYAIGRRRKFQQRAIDIEE